MSRRPQKNETGISHLPGVPNNDIWIAYTCLQCGAVNYENIGQHIIKADDAFNNCKWTCKYCGYVHSKESNLPEKYTNWRIELRNYNSITCQRFWRSFFMVSTANPEYYWKQCTTCGRVLPSTAFAKHKNWSEIEKQQECKACKAAINAVGNPKRTKEQLSESSIRRRLGDLLQPDPDYTPFSDIDDLFERFEGRCFVTGKALDKNNRREWNIDHILPAAYFWPLTKDNAALLSTKANGSKRASWPSQIYTPSQLIKLAKITGADLSLLTSQEPIYNTNIDPNRAVERYLNVREGCDFAKKIKELVKILTESNLIDGLSPENKRLLGIKS
jgi:hypothetical protein